MKQDVEPRDNRPCQGVGLQSPRFTGEGKQLACRAMGRLDAPEKPVFAAQLPLFAPPRKAQIVTASERLRTVRAKPRASGDAKLRALLVSFRDDDTSVERGHIIRCHQERIDFDGLQFRSIFHKL